MDYTRENNKFKNFRNHSFIQQIAETEKWTISTDKKMPMDMYMYEYHEYQVTGAMYKDERSLTTLDKVNELVPFAPNYAFYMDALVDGFVVLDIEPKCPKHIVETMLKTPYIYGETSMSGKGIHLVFPLPSDILEKYPNAKSKYVMRHEKGYYEILLEHYITFTGDQIQPASGTVSFELLFEDMCKDQKPSVTVSISAEDVSKLKPENIPYEDRILKSMSNNFNYRKTPADFDDNTSKYEWFFISYCFWQLKNVMKSDFIRHKNHEYTHDEIVWLLYEAVKNKLPPREKHNEPRSGIPYLLWRCYCYVEKDKAKQQGKGVETND